MGKETFGYTEIEKIYFTNGFTKFQALFQLAV